ncbi:MAG: GHKL domain-containing protein [Bacteroidia bacterium]|nr:GHKL domain-containing protein [Bacteroidia bacterium]
MVNKFRTVILRKYIFLLFSLLLFFTRTEANDTLFYTDPLTIVDIAQYVQIYKDPTNAVSFEQIKNFPDTAFEKSKNFPLSFGNTKSSIWLKFSVKNQTSAPVFLGFGSNALKIIDVFIYDESGMLTQRQSGSDRPTNSRDLQRSNVVLNIGQSPQLIYIKMESRYSLRLPLTLSLIAPLNDIYHKRDVINGLCLGILLAMALYNLFIFFFIRDRLYLYYCLYVLSGILVFSHINGLWYLVRTNNYYINHFLGLQLLMISSVLFSARFLNLKQNMPRVYIAFIFLSIILIIDIPFDLFFIPFFTNYIVQIIPPFLAISLLIIGIIAHVQGNKSAKYYVLAWGFYFVGGIISALSHEGLLPHNFFTLISLQVGACIECILLGFAMANRINTYREESAQAQALALKRLQENETLIKEQSRVLEEMVSARTVELETSLEMLKTTQTQLIHSEKMASLGELTAGIAHEIQNPLNFVNNFSDLSIGLVSEIQEEMQKPQTDEPYIKELFDDLSKNQGKINHHGKRASNIVKGMLQHSRKGTAQKELTDINNLCDEYFRLAYHGLRAKDKSFNAEMKTDFDPATGTLNINSQDVGRVFLNIITNAFHAVMEKSRKNISGYQPGVWVQTQKTDNHIVISIHDNGAGIPDSIKDKIFQPFFTTKQRGEGTGLGLSLSYDIIVKGHNGNIDVKSVEGEGTEFIITIPYNNF